MQDAARKTARGQGVSLDMSVKEKLHELVDQLDDAHAGEVLAFLDRLGEGGITGGISLIDAPRNGPPAMSGYAFLRQPPMDLPTLAASQGVQPVTNLNDLFGDFWPEDETTDQFVAAVREWRRDGDHA
jgi:hypothetical protein